jgi:alkylation response protein AidB-like acyl-CoA dehydrogenase
LVSADAGGRVDALTVARKLVTVACQYEHMVLYTNSQLYRDAKIGQIYEGTSNLQMQTIAKQMLS